GGGGGYYSC
ncbi:polymorphic outer membrane protein, partial [Chlamydia psittaci 02DC23]